MTREEAIRELKADYCGNRIICELYPDQCNREDCEIWLAIRALENAENDKLSPESAQNVSNLAFKMQKSDVLGVKTGETCSDTISRQAAIDALDKEYRCTDQSDDWDGLKTAMLIIENLPSAQHETCDTCKYGYFGDGMCDYCRVRYQSHYERRTDG